MKFRFLIPLVLVLLSVTLLFVVRFPRSAKHIPFAFPSAPIPPQFEDKSLFLTPLKLSTTTPSEKLVTGITVPHHLLARDLIADAFRFASKGHYDQLLLLSPDHFNLGKTDISISEADFSTVFGKISTDSRTVKKLEELSFVTNQNFFYREHGLGAELPFARYYFPETKIIALTLKETTTQTEADQLVEMLKKILSKNTLVVQSTDFSHYLTPEEAAKRDTETLSVLEKEDASKLFSLQQPDNTDSIASQYVQMRLQKEYLNSSLTILAHKNSQDYTTEPVESSTSYIVQAYVKNN